ncbi:MAG: hypothetical protein J6C31_06225 [Prevotella sp.]|nr:hypothetical protein [Prevotella sp.]
MKTRSAYTNHIRIILLSSISYIIIMTCACTRHSYPKSLKNADSLCNTNADSAISLLRSIKKDIGHSPEYTRMYYRLLCIQAKDKADRMKPEEEKENITAIVDYYEKHGDKDLLPIAYYYAGRIYRELKEAPQALAYMQKSKDALIDSDNTELLSRVYSQIGYLQYFQEMYDESLKMFTASYKCSKEINDTIGMILGLRDISTAYEAKNKYGKALESLQEAYCLAKQKTHIITILTVETYISSLYITMNKPDSAMKYAQNHLKNIALTDSSSTFSLMMDIYKLKENEDSVIYFCKQIEKVGRVYAKEDAYKNLTEIYLKRKNHSEANRCFKMYNIYKDSVKAIKRTDIVARMNYKEKEKENIMLQEKNNRNIIIIISASAIALILLITFILYIRYSRIRRKEQLIRHKYSEQILNENLQKSEEHINNNKRKIEMLQSRLESTDKENIELRKELEREKERLFSSNTIAEIGIKERAAAHEAIMNSPIYQAFYRMSDNTSDLHPSNKDWANLEKLINREYDNFTNKLNSLCKLSMIEYRVSMLIKLNFEPKRISNLICCSDSNISTIRSRLYFKTFGRKGGCNKWDEFISSL